MCNSRSAQYGVLAYHTYDMAKSMRVIRKTFTMPEDVDAMMGTLRRRFGRVGALLNQSEVVRAGLVALRKCDDRDLQEIAQKLERFRPGRTGDAQ